MPTLKEMVTTLGSFHILASETGVLNVTFPGRAPHVFINKTLETDESGREIAETAAAEIRAYLEGGRRVFEVPVDLSSSTPFQQDIYHALMQVPYGETISYGELAMIAGHPGAARAVGSAMRRNPIVLIVPCHRVVATRGGLGGWSGPEGFKERLLDLESPS